ncbi:uncharacterized protein TNCV_2662561 [Trichonephila clavipes]|nr:uncharacterized protein TNCV_2662561 [Trichonephila clavipes]
MLNDDEIVTSVQKESGPVDDETDEDEDINNESSKGPSDAEVFSVLETAMKWYEQQSECCPTQLLPLLAVKKRRCTMVQQKISDFFSTIKVKLRHFAPNLLFLQARSPQLHEDFLATDHVILNHGQVTWTTPELASPLPATTPHLREDVSALDIFNVHRYPTRRVFSGTGLELVTRQATIRYPYHSATAATNRNFEPRSSDEKDT